MERLTPAPSVRAATALVLTAAVALTVGCTSTGGGPTPGVSGSPTASPAGGASVELPDHAAGAAASWVLEQVDGAVGAPVEEIEERLAPSLLAEVPPDQLVTIIDQMRAAGPWEPGSVDGDENAVVVRIARAANPERERVDLHVGVDDEGLISTLFFGAAPPAREPATSWEQLTEEIQGMPGSAMLVADLGAGDGATCEPRDGFPAGSSAGESLPIGSMIKIYVLAAVVDAIGRGDLDWDSTVAVTDDLRSLPTGRLQDEPTGSEVSVREAAELMISISDNTATDLLIDAVGRDRVQQALVDLGHSDPAMNQPLLSTREVFQLGWGGGRELRERWRDADADGRRQILAELPDGRVDVDVQQIGQVVVWPYGIDWFGTAADLCAAHAGLAERATTPHGAPVREILAINPGGVAADDEEWAYVGFKGGSSTGTMGGSWYAEDVEGRPTVVVLQTAAHDVRQAVFPETMIAVATDALRLAGRGS